MLENSYSYRKYKEIFRNYYYLIENDICELYKMNINAEYINSLNRGAFIFVLDEICIKLNKNNLKSHYIETTKRFKNDVIRDFDYLYLNFKKEQLDECITKIIDYIAQQMKEKSEFDKKKPVKMTKIGIDVELILEKEEINIIYRYSPYELFSFEGCSKYSGIFIDTTIFLIDEIKMTFEQKVVHLKGILEFFSEKAIYISVPNLDIALNYPKRNMDGRLSDFMYNYHFDLLFNIENLIIELEKKYNINTVLGNLESTLEYNKLRDYFQKTFNKAKKNMISVSLVVDADNIFEYYYEAKKVHTYFIDSKRIIEDRNEEEGLSVYEMFMDYCFDDLTELRYKTRKNNRKTILLADDIMDYFIIKRVMWLGCRSFLIDEKNYQKLTEIISKISNQKTLKELE